MNPEYIHIPAGSYTYSQSSSQVTVPDLWFARFPVTNRQYRRFIDYLQGGLPEVEKELSLEGYAGWVRKFAAGVEGFESWLPGALNLWPGQFRPEYDTDAAFSSDDQPVVGVSWYAAKAYCLWLTMLNPNEVHDLPTEVEWEWAAGGGKRKYPWDPLLGKPSGKLANFDQNVGVTTPVGTYPDGATPEGLMDMAGNVWEWQANGYDADKKFRSLRGGSWISTFTRLRCSERVGRNPGNRDYLCGFRVVVVRRFGED